MCIYYLISFTKSIYFLLNFQIPFMFWIIILPLNILYYPTNESIRFSNNLIFLTVLRFIVISATFCQVFAGFSATFFWLFSGFWAGFVVLFWWFLQFQLLFLGFFPAFWLGFGSCFGDFCSFSYFLPVFLRLLGWVWVVSSPPRRYEVWTASFSILACASSVIRSCFSSPIIRSNR